MRVYSAFDGMSCGQVALERANIPVDTYLASEVDKYAMAVTQYNYPNTVQMGDINKIYPNSFMDIDLMIGGSPCQDVSFSGKGKGLVEGERSNLFFKWIEHLNIIKPKYFLLENVRMSKTSEQIITDILGVEPIAINSNLVSGQNRYRLYWTNIPFDVPKDKKVMLQDILENGVVDRDKSHCLDANYWKGGNLKSYFEKNRRQLVFNTYPHDIKDKGLTWRKLTPVECERLQTVPDNYTDCVSNTQRYKMLGNGFTVDIIAHILKGINYE